MVGTRLASRSDPTRSCGGSWTYDLDWALQGGWPPCSALLVVGKDVVPLGHDRVASKPTLGIIRLRWLVGGRARPELTASVVVLDLRVSPAPAVGEALAVLHHEVEVVMCVR